MNRLVVLLLVVVAFLVGALVSRPSLNAQAPLYQISAGGDGGVYSVQTSSGVIQHCIKLRDERSSSIMWRCEKVSPLSR